MLIHPTHQEAVYHGAGDVGAIEAEAGNGIDQGQAYAEDHIVLEQQQPGIRPGGLQEGVARHKGRYAHRSGDIPGMAHIDDGRQLLTAKVLTLERHYGSYVPHQRAQAEALGADARGTVLRYLLKGAANIQADVLGQLHGHIAIGILHHLEAADIRVQFIAALQLPVDAVVGDGTALVVELHKVRADTVARLELQRILQAADPALLARHWTPIHLGYLVVHLQASFSTQWRYPSQFRDHHMLVVGVQRRHGDAHRRDEQVAHAGEHKVVPDSSAEDAKLAEPAEAVQMVIGELRVSQGQAKEELRG